MPQGIANFGIGTLAPAATSAAAPDEKQYSRTTTERRTRPLLRVALMYFPPLRTGAAHVMALRPIGLAQRRNELAPEWLRAAGRGRRRRVMMKNGNDPCHGASPGFAGEQARGCDLGAADGRQRHRRAALGPGRRARQEAPDEIEPDHSRQDPGQDFQDEARQRGEKTGRIVCHGGANCFKQTFESQTPVSGKTMMISRHPVGIFVTGPGLLGAAAIAKGVPTGYGKSNICLKLWRIMTQRSNYRPSEATRHSILRAGTDLFAERGFQDTTIRAIVAKARVNQAAINYHFDGKEGLYREVLKAAADAFTGAEPAAEHENGLSPEESLRRFIHFQLRPLLARDEISRYLRIFAWESVRPSKVLRQFVASTAPPFMSRAVGVVQRFLPGTSDRDALCAAIWLMGQCSVFVRNREHFSRPPFGLKIDEAFVGYLTDL